MSTTYKDVELILTCESTEDARKICQEYKIARPFSEFYSSDNSEEDERSVIISDFTTKTPGDFADDWITLIEGDLGIYIDTWSCDETGYSVNESLYNRYKTTGSLIN